MAANLDLERRDPNDLNIHVQVDFEDVFGEPRGVKSMDCVWQNAYNCFECGKDICYKFLTCLCGICIALERGCEFAVLSFSVIWCCTPCLRYFAIIMACGQKFFGTCINCCFSPLCESCGNILSRIKISKG